MSEVEIIRLRAELAAAREALKKISELRGYPEDYGHVAIETARVALQSHRTEEGT